MKATIPKHIVGYTLTSDYCEIQLPDGVGFAFTRQHPVRGPDGKYDPNAEWCGMFQSRMRAIIKEHGFPILHEEGMKPMEVASPQEPEPQGYSFEEAMNHYPDAPPEPVR